MANRYTGKIAIDYEVCERIIRNIDHILNDHIPEIRKSVKDADDCVSDLHFASCDARSINRPLSQMEDKLYNFRCALQTYMDHVKAWDAKHAQVFRDLTERYKKIGNRNDNPNMGVGDILPNGIDINGLLDLPGEFIAPIPDIPFSYFDKKTYGPVLPDQQAEQLAIYMAELLLKDIMNNTASILFDTTYKQETAYYMWQCLYKIEFEQLADREGFVNGLIFLANLAPDAIEFAGNAYNTSIMEATLSLSESLARGGSLINREYTAEETADLLEAKAVLEWFNENEQYKYLIKSENGREKFMEELEQQIADVQASMEYSDEEKEIIVSMLSEIHSLNANYEQSVAKLDFEIDKIREEFDN